MAMTIVATLFTGVAARPVELLPEIQRLALPIEQERTKTYTDNPAQMFYRDSITLSSAVASADILRQQKPVMEQLGTGHTLFGLNAQSYTRLNSVSVVWGAAEFRTGNYRELRWTDCIDYERVAPYVLGDEVGGNLSTRRYTFSGGYSRQYADVWTIGADAAYRAEIAYRNHDPRVKTVVSDLDLRFGVARAMGGSTVGISAGLNVYNQNCDLDFYNPINDINTYTLTGLGTYYRRFMGNTNKNSGYQSLGYSVSAQWLPKDGNGLSAQVSVKGYRMNQMLRNFNNLTLGYTDNNTIAASAAWRMNLSPTLTFRPMIGGQLFTRKGTENLFGTTAGSSYDKIGDRKPYTHNMANVSIALPLQLNFGQSYLTFAPSATYDYNLEKYNSPKRRLCSSRITPALLADFSSRNSTWLWNVSCNGFYGITSSEEPILTDLDLSSTLGKCVEHSFNMLSTNRTGFGISAKFGRTVKSIVLSISASYNYTNYNGQGNCQGASLGLSAEF